MYKYVFFDLDGTVLNTIDDLSAAGNYALKVQGFPTHDTESYKYFVGNGIPKLIERILPQDSSKYIIEKTHTLFSEYYAEHCIDMTRPYEGIREMLEALTLNGITSVVITNKDNVFAGKLIRLFLGTNVAAVYGSIEGFPRKPDPYWVNKAISDFGAKKHEILYAGDSGVDIQTAKNAGLVSVGVLWGFRKKEELMENGAEYICAAPSELLDIALGRKK